MKRSVFEVVYLAKILLKFSTSNDVKNFIMVSHKCEEAVKCLKVNPCFINDNSFKWFLNHFQVETIDFDNCFFNEIEVFKRCKLIRNPLFEIFMKNGQLNEEFISCVFPKVKRLYIQKRMIECDDEKNDQLFKETFSVIIRYSKLFDQLDFLEGDLEWITMFMENYTNNGVDIYIKMPKIIHITSYNGFAIKLDETVISLIERLEKCIPNNGLSNVSLLVLQHPENKEVLIHFKKIRYYYRFISDEMCNEYRDHLDVEKGTSFINGAMKNNSMNEIIEKSYPILVFYRYVQNREKENWTVPNCIKIIRFERNKTQWGLSQKVNVRMENVEQCVVCDCISLSFELDTFFSLKELSIQMSESIQFTQIQFNQLNKLFINNSSKIRFIDCTFNVLKEVKVFNSRRILIPSNLNGIEEISLVNCEDCTFNIFSFKNKKVYIEESYVNFGQQKVDDSGINNEPLQQFNNNIKFNAQQTDTQVVSSFVWNETNENNPMKFANLELSQFKEMIESVFEYPFDKNKLDKKVFKVRPFVPPISSQIKIKNRKIIQTTYISDGDINMAVSNNFYTEQNKQQLFNFMTLNGECKTIKNIRYFEVKVKGVSFVSIGLIDTKRYFSFDNCHVGWNQYSIGYHADDGIIFNGFYNRIQTNLPYGNEVGIENVGGCGYNGKTHEVFFTRNGVIVQSITLDWESISAAIACDRFNEIMVNCGEEPFKFDLSIFE
ncbi:hypothetical protein EDI_167520 [Entamoeba dispar SAW760]|uniref:B30.2/SPRY domain-containing protein n=1 Tax=Entamoeba dispar (strain ATCC PRA-260 / SAW760) TaxID=370354 RepID=B0EP28_ENTDS|nr:uncharacterized protein EDI_167520 [Entamoeba dispar SAW760]EDR23703.1 hypothetical protein EDI_167520 [Entamoeba dispar SAW760]|eukprot:EDR23703.1 hypothetical protein EDI_167520 [Entamoeba dispar SAW760]